jgi:hypothetical protein
LDWKIDSNYERKGKISFTISGENSSEARWHAEYYFGDRYTIALNQRMITRAPSGET